MSKCPHCDSIKINPFVKEGDGKCDECHGTGLGTALDQFAANLVHASSQCLKCTGTGQCQTCGGTGTVADKRLREFTLDARQGERHRSEYETGTRHESASSSSDTGSEVIGRLIGGAIAVFAILWFVFSVAIPLAVINIAVVALVTAAAKKELSRYLLPLSVGGGVLLAADYSNGWFTRTLVENVSALADVVPVLFYLNTGAALIAAYLIVRRLLNDRSPPAVGSGEFTQRNLTTMGALLTIGALTVGLLPNRTSPNDRSPASSEAPHPEPQILGDSVLFVEGEEVELPSPSAKPQLSAEGAEDEVELPPTAADFADPSDAGSTCVDTMPAAYASLFSLEAEIADPDGYTYVRSMPSTDAVAIDTVRVGERFRTFRQAEGWWSVLTRCGRMGYMHSSRVRVRQQD